MQTAFPLGFNDSIYHEGNISEMPGFYVFSLLEIRKRMSRSHAKRQKGNGRRKICTAQNSNVYNNDLSTKLREHGRHAILSFLSSLPIPVFYAFWILRRKGFTIGIAKCMRLHF